MKAMSRRLAPLFAVGILIAAPVLLVPSTASAAAGTATRISTGGYHACAITPKERLKCWGENSNGQLGVGAAVDEAYKPMLVPNLKNVKKIEGGGSHTCAILKGGKLKCWGYNSNGQVGDGSTDDRYTPKQVVGMKSGVKQVSAGEYHTCAVKTNGKAKCWGYNGYGELGDRTTDDSPTPVLVKGSENFSNISAGYSYTCATINEKAKCWGYNGDGELGDGTNDDRNRPTQVLGLDKKVKKVVAGYYTTCAIVRDGRVKCWGENAVGEVGTGVSGNEYNTPQNVVGMDSGVTNVDPDYYFTCATKDGKAKCWGDNDYYQIGNGTTDDSDVRKQVSGLTKNVKTVDTGYYTGCALLENGAAKCWGWNGEGEVGIDDEVNDTVPTPKRVLL